MTEHKNTDKGDVSELYRAVTDVPPKKRRTKEKGARRPIVCPPDTAGRDLRTRVLGYLARVTVVLFAVFGLAFFVTDAFKFHYTIVTPTYTGDPITTDHTVTGVVFLAALISVLVLSAVCIFRRIRYALLGTIGAAAAALTVAALLVPRVGRIVYAVFATLVNSALERLHRVDFFTLVPLLDFKDAGLTEQALVSAAAALLTAVIAAVFVPFLIVRARLLPPAILSGALIVFIFCCNISRSNWAFVLLVSSFAAVIVMGAYDKLYYKKAGERDREAAVLFPEGDRPKMPREITERDEIRREKRSEQRRLRSERRIRRKAEAKARKEHVVTVDEELSDYYFSAPKEKNEGKPQKTAERLTPGERKARKLEAKREKKALLAERRQNGRRIRREVAAVRKYDRVTADSRAAMGGLAGIVVFVLLFLLLLVPALTVTGRFKTLPAIDERLEYFREYLTALLVGDEDILDELAYERDRDNFLPHTAELTDRYYDGTALFYVRSKAAANIYLRGWIATDFKDDAWSAVSSADVEKYRELYSLDDAPAEEIKARFYESVLKDIVPDLFTEEADLRTTRLGYLSNYGIVLEEVSVKRLTDKLNSAVYMPSHHLPELSMNNFESNKASDLNYINYFDGLYTGRDFTEKESGYSVVSYVTTMKDVNFMYRVATGIAQYNMNVKLCEIYDTGYFTHPDVNPELIVTKDQRGTRYAATYAPYNVQVMIQLDRHNEITAVSAYVSDSEYGYDFSTFESYVMTMTRQEKNELREEHDEYLEYRDLVYATYLETMKSVDGTDSEILQALAETLSAEISAELAALDSGDAASYEARHAYVLAVINYMKENCTYLSFDEETYDIIIDRDSIETDPTLNSVENFLTVTKQGTCVQFASALTLLLREKGIPARYVEGYLVNDQTRDRNYRDVYYHGTVRDFNFHAWVEVWFDGIGWVQYEATPGEYYDDMYSSVEDALPDSDDPYEPSPDEETPEEEMPDEEKSEEDLLREEEERRREALRKLILTLLLVLGCILVIVGAVTTVVLLARRREAKRDELIERAQKGSYTDEERREIALALIDETTDLLSIYGLIPLPGEMRPAYADRLLSLMPDVFGVGEVEEGDDSIAPAALTEPLDVHRCMAAIGAEEFGNGMTRDGVKDVAELFRRVRTQKKRFVPFPKRFVLHYFGHKL